MNCLRRVRYLGTLALPLGALAAIIYRLELETGLGGDCAQSATARYLKADATTSHKMASSSILILTSMCPHRTREGSTRIAALAPYSL